MNWSVLWMPLIGLLLIAGVTAVVAVVVGLLIGRAMRRSSPQVATGARRLGMTIVGVVGGIVIVQQLGVSPAILLVVVALMGAASLLALREQLENVGARYFSDVYVPFKVGDAIEVAGRSGRVIEINPMCTVLLTSQDQLVAVPNSTFAREVTVNTTPHAWKELVIPLTVGSGVDLPAFESEILKSLSKLKLRLDPRFPPVLSTKSSTPTSTDLQLTVMIRRPGERDALLSEVNQRVTEIRERASAGRRGRSAGAS